MQDDNTLNKVAKLMADRIHEMRKMDKLEKNTYSTEEYILFALEEVEANDGVVINIINTK